MIASAIKTALRDNEQVEQLARALGAWPAIESGIRRGKSGAVITGDWVITHHLDGLSAFEVPDPDTRTMLAAAAMFAINTEEAA